MVVRLKILNIFSGPAISVFAKALQFRQEKLNILDMTI